MKEVRLGKDDPSYHRCVLDKTPMRFKFLKISITRCPYGQKVTKTHTILSNMKLYENVK